MNLVLQTEPVICMVHGGWFLKRKAEGVHIQFLRGLGGAERGEILSERLGPAGFLDIAAKESKLHIRHNKAIQGKG